MERDTIYLVRHGETEWNTQGRLQGHLDSHLTAAGIGQAGEVGRALRRLLPVGDAVTIETSDLGRAHRTAAIICAELGLDPAAIVLEPLLREHSMGRWEGLTHGERDARFPGAREERQRDQWHYVVPGGESYELALGRAQQWLGARRRTPITIAVTHEMMSRTIQAAYLGLSPADALARAHGHREIVRLSEGASDQVAEEAR